MKRLLSSLMLLSLLIYLCGCGVSGSGGSGSLTVYRLVAEDYRETLGLTAAEIVPVSPETDILEAAVQAFAAPSEDDRLLSPVPAGMYISSAMLEDGIVNVSLSGGSDDLSGIAKSELCACLALTLCALPDVDGVTAFCGDEQLCLRLSPDDLVLYNTVVSPSEAGCRLYFPKADGSGMGFEYRTVSIDENSSAQRSIVEELIKGPTDPRLRSDIPPETVLLSINTENGLCTVSLSAAFLGSDATTKETAMGAVYSIVESLTSVKGVVSVQFLIDGRQTASICGVDTSSPLTSLLAGDSNTIE